MRSIPLPVFANLTVTIPPRFSVACQPAVHTRDESRVPRLGETAATAMGRCVAATMTALFPESRRGLATSPSRMKGASPRRGVSCDLGAGWKRARWTG